MKKTLSFLLVIAALMLCVVPASAVVKLETIDAPYGVTYKVYNDTVSERVSISCLFTDNYAAISDMTNEESMEKYGITDIFTVVQIDYRIDGGKWQSNATWGTTYDAAEYGGEVPKGDTVRTFDLLYLNNEATQKKVGDLCKKNERGQNVFDLDNHTLEFRLRTFMGYTTTVGQVITSDWTEVVNVERDADFGKAPDKLDAPQISDAQVKYQENEMPYLSFEVMTPESIKKAEAWFSTQQPTYISMLVEIDRGQGSWENIDLALSESYYANETKGILLSAVDVEDVSKMRLRTRYLAYVETENGTQPIYSEYSDVLEYDVPRWVEGKGLMHAKCKVCGICHPVFGQCMFVIGGIILLIVAIAAVPLKMHMDKVKAKKFAEEEEKQRKLEEERKAYEREKQAKKQKNKKNNGNNSKNGNAKNGKAGK